MRMLGATAAIAVVMAAGLAQAEDKDLPPVAVYLVQPKAQFVDTELQQRIDSTKDMRYAFSKKLVRLVESPEEATIVLEVLGRTAQSTDQRKVTRNAFGQLGSESMKEKVVAVKLTVGDYSTQIDGHDAENEYTVGGSQWKVAAFNAVHQIENWIKKNRDKLAQK